MEPPARGTYTSTLLLSLENNYNENYISCAKVSASKRHAFRRQVIHSPHLGRAQLYNRLLTSSSNS